MNAQDPMQYPLELSGAQFRQMVDEASARLAGFLDTLPQQPASQLENAVARARTAARVLGRRQREGRKSCTPPQLLRRAQTVLGGAELGLRRSWASRSSRSAPDAGRAAIRRVL